jgi:hypothetical protein
MKSRGLMYTLLMIALLVILFAFLSFGMSPPEAPNENNIGFGSTSWSLDSTPVVHGETFWGVFADYSGEEILEHSNTIKVAYEVYWGALPYDSQYMSWEVEDGTFSSKSLTLNDLTERWQDSASTFTFKHENDLYQVTFNIPKLEDGTSKYATLTEAWENGELHQLVESL